MSTRNTMLWVLASLSVAGCTTTAPVPQDQYSQQQRVVMTFKNDDVIRGRVAPGSEVRYITEGKEYLARVAQAGDSIVLVNAQLLSDRSPEARQAKLMKLKNRRDSLADASNPIPVPREQIASVRADIDTLRKTIAADRTAIDATQQRVDQARSQMEMLGTAGAAQEDDQSRVVDVRDRLMKSIQDYQDAVTQTNDARVQLSAAGVAPAEVDTFRVRFDWMTPEEANLVRTERTYRENLTAQADSADSRKKKGRQALMEAGRNKQKQQAAQAVIDEAQKEIDHIRDLERQRGDQVMPLVKKARYRDSYQMAAAFSQWTAMREASKGYMDATDHQKVCRQTWEATNGEASALAQRWGVAPDSSGTVTVQSMNALAQRMAAAGQARGGLTAQETELARLNADLADRESRLAADMNQLTQLMRSSGIDVASEPDVEKTIPAYELRRTRYEEWQHLEEVEIPRYEKLVQEQIPFAGPERDRLTRSQLDAESLSRVALPKNDIQSIEEIRYDKSKTTLRLGFWGYAAIILGMVVSGS